MKLIVWVLLVFHSPSDRLPSAGIFTHETKAACEESAQAWKYYACVKVEVPKPK